MKKIKNVMLLAIGSMTVMAIALTSCKKDAAGPSGPAPTISAVSSGVIVANAPYVIEGSNLTGATITVDGHAVTGAVITAGTKITFNIPSTVTTAGTGKHIVVTTGGGSATQNVTVKAVVTANGWVTSDSVAHASLLAYFPFSPVTTSTEAFSTSIATTSTGVTYTTDGPLGYAASLTDGYFKYPAITALNNNAALSQFTVSMWIKTHKDDLAEFPSVPGKYNSLFQISSEQLGDIYGPMAITMHKNESHGGDTLALGAPLRQIDGTTHLYNGATGTDHLDDSTDVFSATGNDAWVNLVVTFDGYDPIRPLTFYVNGTAVGTRRLGFGTNVNQLIQSGENLNLQPGGGDDIVTIGTFHFSDDFGASSPWGGPTGTPDAASKIYWEHGITAEIAAVRVYSTPLSATEVGYLNTLGSNGQ
jgi:hypothetical protein